MADGSGSLSLAGGAWRAARAGVVLLALVAVVAAPLPAADTPAREGVDREALAASWLDRYTRLREALPRLTAAQAEWLASQRRAGTPQRELRLRSAWHVENARRHVGYLVDALGRIRDGGFAPRREMALWSYVVVLTGDYTFWDSLDALVERGELDRDDLPADMDTGSAGFLQAVVAGQQVLLDVVIPWLRSPASP